MWGVVIGIIGIGLWLYDHATRTEPLVVSTGAPGSPNSRSTSLLAARNPWDLDTPLLRARAEYCGLQPGDWRDATRWAQDNINPNLPVLNALQLVFSASAWNLWPNSARRVYCTYLVSSAPPVAGPAKPIGWH